MELQLIDYEPQYQPYFEKFNKAWLEEYFTVEPLDKWVLENPEEAMLNGGGKIYFATDGPTIIGTVGLRFIEDGVYEMTKMAVDRYYRGAGAGKFLCQSAIDKAREMGLKKLILYSNRVLKNAIHIYHKLGFTEIPVVQGTYVRSDIMMEIDFENEVKALTDQEVEQFRAETKGTTERIHFNNAGASLPPDVVVETVIEYLREEAVFGGYETEAKYGKELDNVYSLIAQLINADKDEITLVENASTAWGIAFNGIDFKEGDEIITCEMEYASNLIGFINVKKNHEVEFKVIPYDEKGNFPLQALKDAITPKTKLIAMTQTPSTAGGMIPVVEIGKISRKHNILYLVDACQSAGQIPIDVKEIDCDMLSVTGRKYLRAPRGTGFLFVRKVIQDQLKPIFMDNFCMQWVSATDFELRNDAKRFELYEKNRAVTLGLGKAVEYALNIGIDRIWKRVQYLGNLLRRQLADIDGITVHDFGEQQCGIVTFSVKGKDAAIVKNELAGKHINVSVGKAVSTLIYMEKHHLATVVRASVHYYNTEAELKTLCGELKAIVKEIDQINSRRALI